MFEVPSNATPVAETSPVIPIVLAVVNFAAEATDFVASDVLSTLPNPICVFVTL